MRDNAPQMLDDLDFSGHVTKQPRSPLNLEVPARQLMKSPSFMEKPKHSMISPVASPLRLHVHTQENAPNILNANKSDNLKVLESPCMISDTHSMMSGTSSASTRH